MGFCTKMLRDISLTCVFVAVMVRLIFSSASTSSSFSEDLEIETGDSVFASDFYSIPFFEPVPHTECDCRDEPALDIVCRCTGMDIVEFPTNLSVGVSQISLVSVGIEVLGSHSLQPYSQSLRDLYMEGMLFLHTIEVGTFHNLRKLRTLYVKEAPKLKSIPDGVFVSSLPNFRILRIVHSGLEIIPNMHHLYSQSIISMVDFDSNRIKNITSGSVKVRAEYMNLDYNDIEVVEDWAFHGSEISELSLKGNRRLRTIAQDAFTGLQNLRRLDLSQTSIQRLPTQGLEDLELLRVIDTHSLKEFPSVFHFREITEAQLTYSYHCCAFQFPDTQDPEEYSRIQSLLSDVRKRYCSDKTKATPQVPYQDENRTTDEVKRKIPTSDDRGFGVFGEVVYTPPPQPIGGIDNHTGPLRNLEKFLESERINMHIGFGSIGHQTQHQENPIDPVENIEGVFHTSTLHHPKQPVRAFCGDFAPNPRTYKAVKCRPAPDAFNPCEDVMGSWPLRVCVWIVAVAAMFGNLAVMGVLMVSARMTVSKFLMCHLAFADFCMGLYLFMIACVDVHTKGVYFNHAIYWQHGAGCQVAGFLTVFASELSIFTLTVITLERWYAITYAIHLNRRLQLGTAAKVMFLGWMYALGMASLPLFGISSYVRTSICLPMGHEGVGDLIYLTCLLTLNGFAFMLVCACYAKMYISIRASRGSSSKPDDTCRTTRAARSDTSVAKRMALLVFTDFACWAPIAFFGLTAVAGYPLIDLTKSKILLVFFYPLNSCANPFLYAILTKQYRRDVCFLLSKFRRQRANISTPRRTTLSTNVHTKTSLSNDKKKISLLLREHNKTAANKIAAKSRTSNSFFGRPKEKAVAENVKATDVPKRPAPLPINLSERQIEAADYSSDEEHSSPAFRRGSPHPIKSSFAKLSSPNLQQEVLLCRILGETSTTTESQDNNCTVWFTKPLVSTPPSERASVDNYADTCV